MRTPKTWIGLVSRPLAGLLLVCLVGLGEIRAAGRAATLEAIHHLENPRNLTRPGPRGELGAYQFRVSTWRMHTALPFAAALDRQTSDLIAVHELGKVSVIRVSLGEIGSDLAKAGGET